MAFDWRKEYDQRQYRLMADLLERFEERKTDLPSLVVGLKTLLAVLEAPDEAWKNDFRREWAALEIVLAVALDHLEQGLIQDVGAIINDPTKQVRIKQAVNNLKKLLANRIEG
jgi:hypothetical protein